ncbi:tetratricopeptide repeat protein [Cohnella sp. GCM10027633]|uniref:tetratricopeptide repeat protein n=1 Tax=unclassified Cohnella TaxID=2636738 RepID=UPI003634E570
MSKLLAFGALWWLFGNPFIAIIVLLLIFYFLERRYIGLTPSLIRPLKRRSAIARWKRQIQMSPHDVSAKSELARLLIERKSYAEARGILTGIEDRMDHSAEFWSDLGTCELALGRLAEGEEAMLRAIEISPRVKYGQPYIRLAESFSKPDPEKAIGFLQRFKEVNSSSCEAYYRLGAIYAGLGRTEDAAIAYRECAQLYRTLPRYMKRHERKWAIRAWLRSNGSK